MSTARKKRPEYPPLDPDQIRALAKFIAEEGRDWRNKLSDHWMKASAPPDLHRIRNTHGPSWLWSLSVKTIAQINAAMPKGEGRK